MARRTPSIERFAARYGETVVAMGHLCRVTNDAEGGAATRMGTGSREHVRAPWLASMLVTAAIRDPKNAALLTGGFAKLKLDTTRTRAVLVTEREPGSEDIIDSRIPETIETRSFPSKADFPSSPFEALVQFITSCAIEPEGEVAKQLQRGMRINIHLSPAFWVEIHVPSVAEGNHADHVRYCYFPTQAEAAKVNPPGEMPSPRQVSITAEQIAAAAELYADTLQHDAAAAPPAQGILSVSGGGEPSGNDNAGNRCDTVPARVQPSASPTDGFPGRHEDAREKRKIQGNRSHLAGRSPFTSRGAEHDRAHHPAFLASAGD